MPHALRRKIDAAAALAAPGVLAAWAGVFAWLLAGSRYQAFLQPRLKPLLIAGAVLAAALAAAALYAILRRTPREAPQGGISGTVLVLIPIAFLWMVYGETLGQHALSKRAFVAGRNTQTPAPAPEPGPAARAPDTGPPKEATLADLSEKAGEFMGANVAVEGMVSRAGGLPEGWILLFRFQIVCCAADAQPVGVMVRGRGFEKLSEDCWARIEGRFETLDFEGEATPAISAVEARPIPVPPPEKRYLFK